MQLPPAFQSTGVATLRVAVSWRLSITRRISSKFRPVEETPPTKLLKKVFRKADKVLSKTCGGWVQERQLQPLVRANDEHRPERDGR